MSSQTSDRFLNSNSSFGKAIAQTYIKNANNDEKEISNSPAVATLGLSVNARYPRIGSSRR
ncbi:MAG: hypothetical protein AAGA60_12305 [Cyanobacteria bacterium P01_E01_bin.42]